MGYICTLKTLGLSVLKCYCINAIIFGTCPIKSSEWSFKLIIQILLALREMRVLTLRVPYVELVDLFGELILLDGLGARNRKRETPFEVLHLVHRVEEQTLGEERVIYNNKYRYSYMHLHILMLFLKKKNDSCNT